MASKRWQVTLIIVCSLLYFVRITAAHEFLLTQGFKLRDFFVPHDVPSPVAGADVEDDVSQKRPLHGGKWADDGDGTSYHRRHEHASSCVDKFSIVCKDVRFCRYVFVGFFKSLLTIDWCPDMLIGGVYCV